MTIRELIKALDDFDPELQVFVQGNYTDYYDWDEEKPCLCPVSAARTTGVRLYAAESWHADPVHLEDSAEAYVGLVIEGRSDDKIGGVIPQDALDRAVEML